MIFVIFIFLANLKIFDSFFGIVSKITSSFQYAFFQLGEKITNFKNAFILALRLQRENEELKAQIISLKSEIASLSELKTENEVLREELSFSKKEGFKLIPAQVIGFEPSNLLQSLIINKGTDEGIAEKMAVVLNGALVGRVVEVSSKSSKVLLISDPNSHINALIQKSRLPGIVKGQVGGGLLLDLIPQNEDIQPGDLMVSSPLGGDLPSGILIGEISEVHPAPGGLFQQAQIRSPLNFKKLEEVFIIIGYESK